MEDNAAQDLTLADIAGHAGMSTRTLNRHFRQQTGTTPLQWLHRTRIRQAQYLLEATDHPIDRIATQVGFGSPTAFRDRFKRIVGTSPNSYRAAFHSSGAKPDSPTRSLLRPAPRAHAADRDQPMQLSSTRRWRP